MPRKVTFVFISEVTNISSSPGSPFIVAYRWTEIKSIFQLVFKGAKNTHQNPDFSVIANRIINTCFLNFFFLIS